VVIDLHFRRSRVVIEQTALYRKAALGDGW
jgi:hypothetical protein